ncbi:unnamed protein product [Medioppia subpectinata]|uniref:Dysbindin n=1 Tax=Medioppia subpectinata TaxID=1979941 RepID=A0A7R9KGU0_9ACAR|nr:unnamed protein product [Medioppia subpectinata]CAG2101943.1 unnamed protein product [Medioppia subpectinata]
MLEQLRDKLQTVQNDLTTSIRGLTQPISPEAKDEVRTKLGFHRNVHKSRVNLNAGSELLQRYQTQWQRMHEMNESNVKSAEEISAAIHLVDSAVKKQDSLMNELLTQLSALPQLMESMESIEKDLIRCKNDFLKVENMLTDLEDEKELDEMEALKIDQHLKIEVYKDSKSSQLEALRVKLAVEHTDRVHTFERQQQNILKERQEAFQMVFEEELNRYKTHGRIEPKVQTISHQRIPSIDEIEIETEKSDEAALEEFLQS